MGHVFEIPVLERDENFGRALHLKHNFKEVVFSEKMKLIVFQENFLSQFVISR
jgi:hypothetical protein